MLEPVTEPVRRLIAKYENRIERLEKANGRLCEQINSMPEIVRCRDCKHATISTTGVCKYCEMFVLPDTDGYGADQQVNLPLDFFCGFAERKEVD